jgi:small subunit ribosomal protein S6
VAERHRDYECCALFKPDLEPEELDAQVEAVSSLITNRGGKVERTDRWNKRLLAYPIKQYTDGYYVVYRFVANTTMMPDLNYHLRYSDSILRYLVLDYTEKDRKRNKRIAGRKATQAAAALAAQSNGQQPRAAEVTNG